MTAAAKSPIHLRQEVRELSRAERRQQWPQRSAAFSSTRTWENKAELICHLPFVLLSRGWNELDQLLLPHHMRLVKKVANKESMLLFLVESRVLNPYTALLRGGMYWVVHPRRPIDFPRHKRCPKGKAWGKSRGRRAAYLILVASISSGASVFFLKESNFFTMKAKWTPDRNILCDVILCL